MWATTESEQTLRLESRPWEVEGTILHVGAGRASLLEEYLGTDAHRIILVEPEPETCNYLQKRLQDKQPRVQVVRRALAESDGRSQLEVYSSPGLTSLSGFAHASPRFPGLHPTVVHDIVTWSWKTLFEKVSLSSGRAHCLIVEAPGQEINALNSIARNGLQERLSHVVISVPARGAARDMSVSSSALIQAIHESGYRLSEAADDGDRTVYAAVPSEYWSDLQKTKALLEELHSRQVETEAGSRKMERLQPELEAQAATAENLRQELDDLSRRFRDLQNHANAVADENSSLRAENRRLRLLSSKEKETA